MWSYLWPVLIVVGANTLYNICAKSTPEDANSFASLCITYVVAAAASLIMFFVTSDNKNFFHEVTKSNWSSIVLGFVVVALEFGYIYIYRAGWKVSTGSLVANISLACVLVFVGLLFYKESISFRQAAGMILCGVGLVLITK